MFSDSQNVGTIEFRVASRTNILDVPVSAANMETLFDDDIHEFLPNDYKPQFFLQNVLGEEVFIYLMLYPSKWSTYPLRTMMVLYNTVTTNDASFTG